MAAETVLIIDDAPVNLKLTDILLRKEGYKVHTAANAEEALGLMRYFRPDLVLVDIQMPGMDGLELTRRIKGDPRTQNIVVVALTACAMKEDEQKAIAAGCSGYITKPIDTHTLGIRVREYLEARQAGSAIDPWPILRGALNDAELEGVRRRFLEKGARQCHEMIEHVERGLDAPKTAALLHQWVRTAAILGYPTISELARRVAGQASSERTDVARLREWLTDLSFAFSESRESLAVPLPDRVLEMLRGKTVVLAGFPDDEEERFHEALERVAARPQVWKPVALSEADGVSDWSVLIYYVREESVDGPCIQPGPWLAAHVPLILAGSRERIMALDHSVQARANDFLIDGWQPEEALLRLSFVLSRAVAFPATGRMPIRRGDHPAARPAHVRRAAGLHGEDAGDRR